MIFLQMKKLTYSTLFLLFIFVQLSAQEIDSLTLSQKPALFEKLYLHVDRELYAPGDVIWLKAYQVNGITHQLNSNYRNIFVQLVSKEGKVVKEMILFSIKGQAQGDFRTDAIAPGIYTIRAYTKYLINFGEEACFHKKICVAGPLNSIDIGNKQLTENPKIEVAFLPEGGNLVLNARNTVAFKAIDQKGKGINVSGRIMDDLGDTIVSFNTSYLGMGKFIMMPVDERSYYATIDRFPEMKIKLPTALTDGISLNYKDNTNALKFVLYTNMKLALHRPFYIVASHKGIVLFHQKIDMTDFSEVLNLSKKLFPKGISKITLLDSALNAFTERLIFVDDGNADIIKLQIDKNQFKPREKVTIGAEAILSPGDSITSTLSVAVVNKNYFAFGRNSQNIKSYLLLDSDLKGAIELPASYFIDEKSISSTEKIDLLMLVNGWRAYLWNEVETNKTASLDDWNDAGFEIKGRVKKFLWQGPQAAAKVLMSTVRKNYVIDSAATDQQGRFKFERVFLMDSIGVMLNARTKSGTRNTEIILDPVRKADFSVTADSLTKTCFDIEPTLNFYRDNTFRQMRDLGFNPENGSILLGGVDVVEKTNQLNDSKSTSFKLYSIPDKSFTATKEDYMFSNVFEYLVGKVSWHGAAPSVFIIDGREYYGTEGEKEMERIPMSEIDKIDVLTNAANRALYGSKGANGGVIAIYLKRVNPYETSREYIKGRITLNVNGFHKPQKFYSPSYTPENIKSDTPDCRPTLFWDPRLSFEDGKANIDFFTSDEQTQYVVTVEGITKNGKICFGTTNFKVSQ